MCVFNSVFEFNWLFFNGCFRLLKWDGQVYSMAWIHNWRIGLLIRCTQYLFFPFVFFFFMKIWFLIEPLSLRCSWLENLSVWFLCWHFRINKCIDGVNSRKCSCLSQQCVVVIDRAFHLLCAWWNEQWRFCSMFWILRNVCVAVLEIHSAYSVAWLIT